MTFPSKVSVIVPVHNAGSYFNKCLDTLVCQTLKELEIILILDCPTDGSDIVAESYGARFPNIKIIRNKNNLHIGNSRNLGLEMATGEYIGFSDHDDFRELNMYEEMYSMAQEQQATVVLAREMTVFTSDTSGQTPPCQPVINTYDNLSFTQDCFLGLLSDTHKSDNGVVHSQIYKNEFLKKYKIRFPDTRYVSSEDHLFNLQVYSYLAEGKEKMVYLPRVFYYHLLHRKNASLSLYYKELNKTIRFLELIEPIIEANKVIPSEKLSQLYEERILKNLYTSWRIEIRKKNIKQAFKSLSALKNSSVLVRNIKDLKYNYNFSFPKKCFSFILKTFYT